MTYNIGQLTKAEQERETMRFSMRAATSTKDKARYKRDFRKARNKAFYIKEEMKK